MKIIDAEGRTLKDLKDEGRVMESRLFPDFVLTTVRHPTLGKLVLVEGGNGNGAVIEMDDQRTLPPPG